MFTKRGRVDSHLTKDSYDTNDDARFSTNSLSQGPGKFQRAPDDILSQRKVVSVQKKLDRKKEFAKHVMKLNSSYLSWFKDAMTEDPSSIMTNASQDALDYLNALEDRYLKSYGEVLTFGNGDCGQLVMELTTTKTWP